MNIAEKEGKDWKKSGFFNCDMYPKTSQFEVSKCIERG